MLPHVIHRSSWPTAQQSPPISSVGNVTSIADTRWRHLRSLHWLLDRRCYWTHLPIAPLTFSWPHLRCDVGLEEGEYKYKLSLCYSIVYYYNGAQRYEQFLQVCRLYEASILLGLELCLPSASVSSVLMVLYRYKKNFCLHPFLYLSWAWWDWPLTWLTNHRPSVLWHCWLGHLTRKTVSEMTYNVSSGTLNTLAQCHMSPCNCVIAEKWLKLLYEISELTAVKYASWKHPAINKVFCACHY